MQGRILVIVLLSVALTEGFLFGSKPKCPIHKYKSGKNIVGDQLLINENFQDRVKSLETVAKDCKVHVYIKGSYYQLPNPAQQVLVADADLVIGHGFQFELRDEGNAMLCNKICLSKNPTDIAEVRCFLQGAANRGFTWSRYNSNVLSDNTYASNTSGYQALKVDIQTKCKDEKFKRALLRALRKMYDEEEGQQQQDGDDEGDNKDDDDKKKKK